MKMIRFAFLLLCAAAAFPSRAEQTWVDYEPPAGKSNGKHIVFLSGDEEYRSEEGLPMLAKILSQRHGFKCTVLFSVDPDGTINPNKSDSLSNAAALDSADAIVMLLRWRKWPAEDMRHFVDAFHRGVPIIGLRTSTHAFQFPASSEFKEYNTFGKRVLGEEWVNHWGQHKSEATKGIFEESAKNDPILRGVDEVFGDTDVYEAYPPSDAKILIRGQVLKGMNPDDPPASYKKRTAHKTEQDVNDPMMPVVWTREFKNENGKVNRAFCTTMGAATDLQDEGLRRLVVNAVYWGLKMDVPQRVDVNYVGEYHPTTYGFNGFKKSRKPSDFALAADRSAQLIDIRVEHPNPKEATAAANRLAENAGGVSPLELKTGEHVAILGNALPDRMQHTGYFETLVEAYYPREDLVFRNISKAGDEVATWHRSENFGSRDDWLKKVKADVILAFYGFNESTKGPAGLEQFKEDLANFLKETKQKNYSDKGNVRIVLFSPIAEEQHQDPNFPNAAPLNRNIALYAAAMKEVAAANSVQFVDLYAPSLKLYGEAANRGRSLTVNGHYLTPEGDRLLAPIIFESIFGRKPADGDFEKLREVINEKNEQWHHRYRTIDGYNVFGGRSALAYEPGKAPFITDRNAPPPYISNYKVMQEEMSQRDVLTANRDKRVWAVAKGGDLVVDDSNLPPVEPAPANKPGPEPDGKYDFLSGEEAIAKMVVHPGMKVNLFADEKQFPELIKPVQMAWDT
ncbi:MAG TPA: ThuA domain-containing protein, partial [Verrucomicrobiae bacterium]|nr:ThuA domain-containing protein [Verrucomicrobiae bacterium]